MATELQSEVQERVTGYIKHNAKKSNEAVLGIVEQGHKQLLEMIDSLSEEQATFKPSAEEWSVLDTMQHVVAAKKGVARMCEELARGEQPEVVAGRGDVLDLYLQVLVGEEVLLLRHVRADERQVCLWLEAGHERHLVRGGDGRADRVWPRSFAGIVVIVAGGEGNDRE